MNIYRRFPKGTRVVPLSGPIASLNGQQTLEINEDSVFIVDNVGDDGVIGYFNFQGIIGAFPADRFTEAILELA